MKQCMTKKFDQIFQTVSVAKLKQTDLLPFPGLIGILAFCNSSVEPCQFFQKGIRIELVAHQDLRGRAAVVQVAGEGSVDAALEKFVGSTLDVFAVVAGEAAKICLEQDADGEIFRKVVRGAVFERCEALDTGCEQSF